MCRVQKLDASFVNVRKGMDENERGEKNSQNP